MASSHEIRCIRWQSRNKDALIGAGGRANMLYDKDDNAPRNRAFKAIMVMIIVAGM